MNTDRRAARALLTAGAVVVLAGGMLAVGSGTGRPGTDPGRATAVSAAAPADPLAAQVRALQVDLRRAPGNHVAWAQLGAAYVQQARLSADPSLYAKAEAALAESLRRQPDDNDLALAGQAALAAARHEFAAAVRLADRALEVNPFSRPALAVKVDALVELGRYAESREVLQRMLDLHPGVDSFTRASYAFELQGQTEPARAALQRALSVTSAPADRAFAHHYLGELAWNTGDLPAAAAGYDAALAADPGYVSALAGRAKVKAARGDTDGAVADYRAAIARQPQPGTLLELGELLQAAGRTAEAEQQYTVLRATQQLYAANGQVLDSELALFEADHGDPARAVELAKQAHTARPDSITTQDAYAWALHAAGRDRQALPLARAATRTGLKSPALNYHLGAVAAAAGDSRAARRALNRAVALNPAWNPLQAPHARTLLDQLP